MVITIQSPDGPEFTLNVGPSDIDISRELQSVFADINMEQVATWIISHCQTKGKWNRINYRALEPLPTECFTDLPPHKTSSHYYAYLEMENDGYLIRGSDGFSEPSEMFVRICYLKSPAIAHHYLLHNMQEQPQKPAALPLSA